MHNLYLVTLFLYNFIFVELKQTWIELINFVHFMILSISSMLSILLILSILLHKRYHNLCILYYWYLDISCSNFIDFNCSIKYLNFTNLLILSILSIQLIFTKYHFWGYWYTNSNKKHKLQRYVQNIIGIGWFASSESVLLSLGIYSWKILHFIKIHCCLGYCLWKSSWMD